MTKAELLATARLDLVDTVEPYLWSDEELTGYIQDAEQEAAERAKLLFEDSNDTYCNVDLVVDTGTYDLDSLVFDVTKARISGGNHLDRETRENLDLTYPRWETATGTPKYFIFVGSKLRVVPIPTATGTLILDVYRLPVYPMGTSPEIHRKFHRRMLDWAYRQAFLKRHVDTYRPGKALEHEQMFINSFGTRPDSNVQRKLQAHTPTVVQYGGGY